MKNIIEFFKKKKNRPVLIAVIVCAVLIIAAAIVLCVMFIPGNNVSEAEETTAPETTTEETKTPPDTESIQVSAGNPENIGKYSYDSKGREINPLTGEKAEAATTTRPAAVMINNIRTACPQIGLRNADVIYECLVEGGITRLMVLLNDYSSIGELGSVRSSREYYLDFAQNHDAIYVHAGGSTTAYSEIKSRGINNMDGVNMSIPNSYYRDPDRMANMGYEHSMMINGDGIAYGINYLGYRTEIRDTFKNPLLFADYDAANTVPSEGDASFVTIPYNSAHYPQYEYNAEQGVYYRYQFAGEKHIDGETGEQLSFTNIIIIECSHTHTYDEKNHIDVDPVGSGDGYFISNGKYMPIKWSKADPDSEVSFSDVSGNPLYLNCGKTFINIVSPNVFSAITMNQE